MKFKNLGDIRLDELVVTKNDGVKKLEDCRLGDTLSINSTSTIFPLMSVSVCSAVVALGKYGRDASIPVELPDQEAAK